MKSGLVTENHSGYGYIVEVSATHNDCVINNCFADPFLTNSETASISGNPIDETVSLQVIIFSHGNIGSTDPRKSG